MDAKDNPYAIGNSGASSMGGRPLAEETMVQLDQLRRTLQIIVFALMAGILIAAGFAIATAEGPWRFLGPDRMDLMLGFAVICVALSIVVPILMGQAAPTDAASVQPAMRGLLTGDPTHDQAIFEAQRIQLTTIVGCALLEGGAFANVFPLFSNLEIAHALVVVILVVGIAMRFPTRARYLRRIEVAVEAAGLDQALPK